MTRSVRQGFVSLKRGIRMIAFPNQLFFRLLVCRYPHTWFGSQKTQTPLKDWRTEAVSALSIKQINHQWVWMLSLTNTQQQTVLNCKVSCTPVSERTWNQNYTWTLSGGGWAGWGRRCGMTLTHRTSCRAYSRCSISIWTNAFSVEWMSREKLVLRDANLWEDWMWQKACEAS